MSEARVLAPEGHGRRSRWSMAIALPLAVVLLYLALQGVDWREAFATLRQAHPAYLLLASLMASTSYLVRSLRWRALLSAKKGLPRLTVFWATMVGYLGNNLLPARAGELLRSALLGRRAAISTSFVLATALTERIVDAVVLVLIGIMSLHTLGGIPDSLAAAVPVMAGVGVIGLLVLLVAPNLEALLHRLVACLPLPPVWVHRLLTLLERFLDGMRSLQDRRRAAGFLGLTGLIWLADGLTAVVGAWALGLSLTLPQALLFLAAAGLASAVPSTPGYLGVHQFVAVTVLPLFGLSRSQAMTYIVVAQATGYATVLLWGGLGLWRLGLASMGVLRLDRPTRPTMPRSGDIFGC